LGVAGVVPVAYGAGFVGYNGPVYCFVPCAMTSLAKTDSVAAIAKAVSRIKALREKPILARPLPGHGEGR
jgi:hypothetical protein